MTSRKKVGTENNKMARKHVVRSLKEVVMFERGVIMTQLSYQRN